jgi:NAD(P)-dependent dehydrogenase (short-subunit alcohol dehydrogenase family)
MPHTGQHVVIVGGTAGLGRGVAAACQAAGCTVTITGRDQTRVAAVAQELGPEVRGLALDLANPASITAAFARFERIDHLVLAAIERYHNTIREYRTNEAERIVRVKLVGYAEVVHQALPRLVPDASIVLFGGRASVRPYPGSTMVTTVNAGIAGLTTTLAAELAPIRVNAISPGVIGDTPSYAQPRPALAEMLTNMAARTHVGRLGTTAEIVHAVLFLMDNAYVNGIDLAVDGGLR